MSDVVPGQFRTAMGHLIQVNDPDPRTIDPRDIALALSWEIRYQNHVQRRYCVAEHCCHIHDLVSPELRLQALLHDATEAYLKDMAKPVKVILPSYEALEDALWLHLARRFGLPPVMHPSIKRLDKAIRAVERRAVHDKKNADPIDPLVAGVEIQGWSQARARDEFMRRFQDAWLDPITVDPEVDGATERVRRAKLFDQWFGW